ncbi:MAG TPA: hypothetical protein VGG66_02805 [Rhizomicrobium sp.]|jgi:hypothetical protein
MTNINLGRVLLGGIVAGAIICAAGFVLNGIVLADQWRAVTDSIHRPPVSSNQVILFNILAFVQGIAAVWTYAAIRPRFGAGPRTAVYAALLTWVTCYFLLNVFPTVLGVFPVSMLVILVAEGMVEIVVATLVGAYFYREA